MKIEKAVYHIEYILHCIVVVLKLCLMLWSSMYSLLSVIAGVGELDVKKRSSTSADDMAPPRSVSAPSVSAPSVSPYLLLDVRDPDSYERSHIITGMFVCSKVVGLFIC